MNEAKNAGARRRLDALVRRLGRRGEDLIEPRPEAERGRAVTSLAQDRLWWLEKLRPGSPVYHLAGVLELEGALDRGALLAALALLAARHEALRTTFEESAGVPWQRIHPVAELAEGLLVDLSGLSASSVQHVA